MGKLFSLLVYLHFLSTVSGTIGWGGKGGFLELSSKECGSW